MPSDGDNKSILLPALLFGAADASWQGFLPRTVFAARGCLHPGCILDGASLLSLRAGGDCTSREDLQAAHPLLRLLIGCAVMVVTAAVHATNLAAQKTTSCFSAASKQPRGSEHTSSTAAVVSNDFAVDSGACWGFCLAVAHSCTGHSSSLPRCSCFVPQSGVHALQLLSRM